MPAELIRDEIKKVTGHKTAVFAKLGGS